MSEGAIIIRLEGVLADLASWQVRAWSDVIGQLGLHVGDDRLADAIDRCEGRLVADVLGAAAESEHGPALRNGYHARLEQLLRVAPGKSELQMCAGATELIAACRASAAALILSTSLSRSAFDVIADALPGLREAALDGTWTAENERTSKANGAMADCATPIEFALRPFRLAPTEAFLITGGLSDISAACSAGVAPIAVDRRVMGNVLAASTADGPRRRAALKAAGARVIASTPAELAETLPAALRVAAPLSLHLDRPTIDRLMDSCLEVADAALGRGVVPIAALVVRHDGSIAAAARNRQRLDNDKTAHAEIVALREAARTLPLEEEDLILVSTLEPCVMCTSAAMISGVDTTLFGLSAPYDGGTDRVVTPTLPDAKRPRTLGGVRRAQCEELFQVWLARHGDSPDAAFVAKILRGRGRDVSP